MTPQFLPRKFFAKRAALETNIAGAAVVADALRLALASHAFDPDGASLTVTASFGAAEQPFETTIANADRALYSAKEEGRNRVAVAGV
jgi:PleD family two-component response regulator